MMIGPAPMIRMLWMSVRLGIYFTGLNRLRRFRRTLLRRPPAKGAAFAGCSSTARLLAAQRVLGELELRLEPPQHEVVEALEERAHVVRSRARLRVSLEAERRPVGEGDSLQRAVEQR